MGAKRNQTRKLKLNAPVEWDDELVEELEFQRPKGKHMKKIGSDSNVGSIMQIAAKCSGMPPSFFDEMDGADVTRACEVINDFLEDGR